MVQHAEALASWEAFYVITGSSAAALTGLQFVVITLVADRRRKPSTPLEISAFGTPTVVHFGAVLLLAAILSAPWSAELSAGLLVGLCGVAGVIYSLIILRRALMQTGYRPVLEDWVWHFILPTASYAALVIGSLALRRDPIRPLFAFGAAAVLLLFVGIHNAWDTVTYFVTTDDRALKAASTPATASGAETATNE